VPELDKRLIRAFGPRADRPTEQRTMLMLSGGGGFGAWGAAVLQGWSQAGGRPSFDVVTGISTGAILGTFAFLGGTADDEAMRVLYTQTAPSDVYRTRLLPWALLFSSALRDTAPFRKLLRRHVTDAVIDRVAAERVKHRLFIIGTVDADAGVLRLWDMTELAGGPNPDRYDRYRALLLAATAYPVLFPPVLIDRTLHVDGGTREQIFAHVFADAVQRVSVNAIPKPGPDPTAYLIVNGPLVVSRRCVSERISALGLRAIEIALTQGLIGNLYKVGTVLTPPWQLELSMVPGDFPIDPSKDSFDPGQANRVYQRGLEWAKTLPWVHRKDFPHGTEESPLGCPDRSSD
jgi:predicted acylesterase/phospholipase RssA